MDELILSWIVVLIVLGLFQFGQLVVGGYEMMIGKKDTKTQTIRQVE